MIRVLIADDHVLIREGLKKILKSEAEMEIVGEAGEAKEIISMVRSLHPDVLVLDISLPGKSGLDILLDLKRQQPKLPVLILSMHPEERFAVRALKAGAAGYLTKDSAADQLVVAIRKVSAGGRYISESLAETLAKEIEGAKHSQMHESLSDREYQIFCMIASGRSIAAIAEELSLGISTVNTYRFRILEKMNMKTNAQIIHYALKHQLID